MKLYEFRRQYPMYDDMSDDQLAQALYKKFYADDTDFETFADFIGLGEVDPKDRSFFREAADVPLKVLEGVATAGEAVSEMFGADNIAAKGFNEVQEWARSLASAQSKKDSETVARIIDAARGKGILEEVLSYAEAFTVAPLDFTAQGAGTIAAPLAAGAAAAAMAPASATAALTGATLASTGMGLGIVKGQIYDAVYDELTSRGIPQDQAAAAADEAQAYGGENTDQIALGGILGAIAGRVGIEPHVLGAVGRGIAGRLKTAGATALGEMGTEAMQGGQEEFAANLARHRAGAEDVDLMAGVAGSATLEALPAGVLGGGLGALRFKPTTAEDAENTPDVPPDEAARILAEMEDATPEDVADTPADTPVAPTTEPERRYTPVDELEPKQLNLTGIPEEQAGPPAPAPGRPAPNPITDAMADTIGLPKRAGARKRILGKDLNDPVQAEAVRNELAGFKKLKTANPNVKNRVNALLEAMDPETDSRVEDFFAPAPESQLSLFDPKGQVTPESDATGVPTPKPAPAPAPKPTQAPAPQTPAPQTPAPEVAVAPQQEVVTPAEVPVAKQPAVAPEAPKPQTPTTKPKPVQTDTPESLGSWRPAQNEYVGTVSPTARETNPEWFDPDAYEEAEKERYDRFIEDEIDHLQNEAVRVDKSIAPDLSPTPNLSLEGHRRAKEELIRKYADEIDESMPGMEGARKAVEDMLAGARRIHPTATQEVVDVYDEFLGSILQDIAKQRGVKYMAHRLEFEAAAREGIEAKVREGEGTTPDKPRMIQARIQSSTTGEVFDWLVDNVPERLKPLMNTIHAQYKEMTKLGYTIKFEVIPTTQTRRPHRDTGVSGIEHDGRGNITIMLNSASHTPQVREQEIGGKKKVKRTVSRTGMNYETIARELTRAVIMMSIQAGKEGKNKKLADITKELEAVRLHTVSVIKDLIARARSKEGVTKKGSDHKKETVRQQIEREIMEEKLKMVDLPMLIRDYDEDLFSGFDSSVEFVAWALTNEDTAHLINQFEYKGKSIGKRIWDAIKRMFGLSAKEDTVLAETLRLSKSLFETKPPAKPKAADVDKAEADARARAIARRRAELQARFGTIQKGDTESEVNPEVGRGGSESGELHTRMQEIQRDVQGKSALEAIEIVAEHKNTARKYRFLAKRIAKRMREMESVGFQFSLNTRGAYIDDDANGQVTYSAIETDNGVAISNVISVRNVNDPQRTGVWIVTLLHEYVHAVTISALDVGRFDMPDSKYKKLRQDLEKVQRVIWEDLHSYDQDPANYKGKHPEVAKHFLSGGNAFANIKETLAWGLTHPDAQLYLNSLAYDGDTSVFDRILNVIAKFFGYEAKENSALAEVMRISRELMVADIQPQARFMRGRNPLPPRRVMEQRIEAFSDMDSAIAHVKRTGSPLYKLLMNRLQPLLKGITVEIATSDKDGVLGEYVEGSKAGEGVIRLYIRPGQSGVTAETFLHEALHGALQAKLKAYSTGDIALDERAKNAARQISALMSRARQHYAALVRAGKSIPELDAMNEAGAFSNLHEFVSYALTNAEMQNFMRLVPGTYTKVERQGLLSQFVDHIRNMFSLGTQYRNGLEELVALTEQALDAPKLDIKGSDMTSFQHATNVQAPSRSIHVRDRSRMADLERARGEFSAMDGETLVAIGAKMKRGQQWAYSKILTTLDLRRTIKRIIRKKHPQETLSQVDAIVNEIEQMSRFRNKRYNVIDKISKALDEFKRKYRSSLDSFNDLIHLSSLEQINFFSDIARDASGEPILDAQGKPQWHVKTLQELYDTDKELQALEEALDPGNLVLRRARETRLRQAHEAWTALNRATNNEAQNMYNVLFKAYEETYKTHIRLLEEAIDNQQLEPEQRARLKDEFVRKFQEENKLDVYFPLMRYGKYWLTVGPKGNKQEFYMFESEAARNRFRKKVVADVVSRGEYRSQQEMEEAGELNYGDELDGRLYRQEAENSKNFREIMNALDIMKNASSFTAYDINTLQDTVYQLYLASLPMSDIRRRFQRRQGKAGFTMDVQRNFIVTQTTAANQLARLRHQANIRNRASEIDSLFEGNPRLRADVEPYTKALVDRAESEISTDFSKGVNWDKLASLGRTGVFYYMLTSPRTALAQLTQIPVVGIPTMAAKYGMVDTMRMMKRYGNVFKIFSKDNRPEDMKYDGYELLPSGVSLPNLSALNVANSAYIRDMERTNPVLANLLRRGYDDADSGGLFMSTFVMDMTARGKVSTAKYDGVISQGTRVAGDIMSFLFQNAEEATRKMMFMATLELEISKQLEQGVARDEAYKNAFEAASDMVDNTLFKYSEFNRPTVMRGPLGKVAFQFWTFPLQMASYLIRNFYGMIRNNSNIDGETKKAAAIKFFGTLGMTGVFAGATGMPMYSVLMGLAEGLRETMRPDEDDDDRDVFYDATDPSNPLGYRSLDLWFREHYLPSMFSPENGFGRFFGYDDDTARLLSRMVAQGPVSALTDFNIGTSVNLNDMFIRNDIPADTAKDFVERLIITYGGGALGSMVSTIASGFDDINNGHTMQGIEKLAPAFLRGPMKAFRLNQEGLLTKQDAVVAPEEYYTMGVLIGQSLGLGNTEVDAIQHANFEAKSMLEGIKRKRAKLLNAYTQALREYSKDPSDANDAAIEEVIQDIIDFNYKNGFFNLYIGGDTMANSAAGKQERINSALQGLMVSGDEAAIMYPLVKGSHRYD